MISKQDIFSRDITRKLVFHGKLYDFIPGAVDVKSGEFPEAVCDLSSGTARIWLADFETPPQRGDLITLFGSECRVLSLHYDNFHETAKLAYGDKYNA